MLFRRLLYFISFAYLLGLGNNAFADLVVHWKLDDGQGKIASDSSGNGHHGVFSAAGAPIWVAGKMDGALQFHGGGEYVQYTFPEATWPACTVAVWVKVTTLGQAAYTVVFSNHTPNSAGFQIDVNGGNPGSYRIHPSGLLFGTVKTDWVHLAMTSVGTSVKLYYDGAYVTSGTLTDMLFNKFALAVARSGTSGYLACTIDDLRVYDHALSAAEVQDVMNGVTAVPAQATEPSPADRALDVPRDAVLGWKPGEFTQTHDVYFGTAFTDVNAATRATPLSVLVSQGQDTNAYDPPGVLGFGQTYYWRIDEVNRTPDATVHKGGVWSFTVEPYSYTVKPVAVTASSAQGGMGPEKTIDGSGMTGDQHGTDSMTMWLSTGIQPNWIQYEFDQVYKLYDLQVWNSNQAIESLFGIGAKEVAIEYSTDGTAWATLDNVPEFAKAPGTAGYAANTTVNLGGIMAKYVKLTIKDSWGGVSTTGLSEVRFSYIPVQARAPQPADAATGVDVEADLNWRPGREAASHSVYVGTDANAVALGTVAAQTVTEHAFDPGSLIYGTKYYWKVDEVNAVTYPGGVWSFTTREFAALDDFESYNDGDDLIFDTWIDNYGDSSGSTVGNDPAPFAEQTIVHGGKQSMPLAYNNSGPEHFVSETYREFSSSEQDWTLNGATHLALWYRGYPAATSLAVTETAGQMTLSGDGADIWNNSDEFVYAYKTLAGDGSIVARVISTGTGSNTWAKGGVMIRDSLNGGSMFADTVLTGGGGNGASFQYRPVANAGCSSTDAATALAPPYWVKIERKGDSISGYLSPDGKTWTQQGATQILVMTAPVYIGLCVTSHVAGTERTFQFDSIATTGSVSGQWEGIVVDSPQYNDAAGLYVVVEDSTGKSKLVAHPDPAAAATGAWTRWAIPLGDFTAAGVKMTRVKKLTIGVGDRNDPKAGARGRVYIDDLGFGHPIQ